MAYAAIIASIIGAGASAYGASQAGQGGGSAVSPGDILGLQQYRPLGNETLMGALSVEQLYELGVPTGLLEQEILSRKLEQTVGAGGARKVIAKLDKAQTLAASGDPKDLAKAQKIIGQLNAPYTFVQGEGGNSALSTAFTAGLGAGGFDLASGGGISGRSTTHLGKAGGALQKAGVQISIDANGQLQYNFTGPEAQMVQALRDRAAQSNQIFQGRLNAYDTLNRALAGFQVPTAGDIQNQEAQQADYLNRALDTILQKRRDAIIEAANKGGYSPSGELQQLGTDETQQRLNITENDALQRALQLITGQTSATAGAFGALQSALQPTQAAPLQNAANLSSQNTLTNLQLGLNLGIANAQAEAARNVSQANAYQSLGSDLTKAGLIGSQLLNNNG